MDQVPYFTSENTRKLKCSKINTMILRGNLLALGSKTTTCLTGFSIVFTNLQKQKRNTITPKRKKELSILPLSNSPLLLNKPK